MNSLKSITIIAIASALLLTTSAFSDVIDVPDDYETIQEAIDEAEPGDTVLVAPGVYEENLLIEGVDDLTIASFMLTTGIEAYIDSTVIDGGGESSVVRFEDVGDQFIFNGFTLINGTGSLDVDRDICGGGIHCFLSSPTLINLIIRDNSAEMGGGVFLQLSSPAISYCRIVNNEAEVTGGGIFCSREGANPIISYTLIARNDAGNRADGIGAYDFAAPIMQNVTIVDNDEFGIFLTDGGELEISNSIIWNCDIGAQWGENSLIISYCDVQDGEREIDNCDAEWGEGMIDEDPLFMDADEGDYHLAGDSPCIDTGDPDSPDDPDGSRADMGAFPYLLGGVLMGYVYEFGENTPLAEVQVLTAYGMSATSDSSGFWIIEDALPGDFDLTASKPGYNDSTRTEVLEEEDTLEIDFSLTHPAFVVSDDRFEAELFPDDTTSFDFTVGNEGNGPLRWSVKERLAGDAGAEPWELRQSYAVSEITDDDRIEGVAFAADLFYVSGGRGRDVDDNQIYVIDLEGWILNTFPQPGESTWGIYDLAWDGELLWGGDNQRTIYGFTTEGELITSWEGPQRTNQAITWDSDRDLLWITGIASNDIVGHNTNGEEQMAISQFNFRAYGLAYWHDDPDGYPLYVMHSPDLSSSVIHKIDIENDDTLYVATLEHPEGGVPRGAFIVDRFDPYSSVFMSVSNNADNDRVDIWQLAANTSWMDVTPTEGEILPDDEDQELILTLDATGLDIMDYEGVLIFDHNAAGGSDTLQVSVSVWAGVGDEPAVSPTEFAINEIYPNPFNSTTKIRYSLPFGSKAALQLYDLSGRIVKALEEGNRREGVHTTTLAADDLPSGLYFVRLETADEVATQKVMLIR